MGWTNSVPIFHDDVTYILKEEIPHISVPYIDDVPVRGPKTRYELPEGGFETIAENPGIRRFVWEHFQNLNRVVQRMKYAGGTFSGHKAILCADEFQVVGHVCSYAGRKPEKGKVHTITNWSKFNNISDVRAFLGTTGVLRMFIKDYAKKANGLTKLLRKDVPFTWGPEQERSVTALQESVMDCPCLGNIDLENGGEIILSVDTSYMAAGFYIRQLSPDSDKHKMKYVRFGSITLNGREARFSQLKHELFGLFRTLQAMKHLLYGIRSLVIETDTNYIQGMLQHRDEAPNAVIN